MSQQRESESKCASHDDGSGVDVYRVGVRVPPFYPEKPALWFAQLESQFALANITSDATKYHHVMGGLDPIYAAHVEDIVEAPAAPDKYERLKTELVRRLSASKEKKVQQLLTHEELGDRKPSQFLRHLRHLAGPSVPEDFLRTIWTSRLPSSTQTIIASQAKASLEEVAELADRIQDLVPASPQVAATSSPAAIPGSSVDQMHNQIAELTRQVQALTSQVNRLSRPRHRSSRSTSRGRSSSTRSHSNYRRWPNCWYHYKFGEKATRCVKPCDYAGKAAGSR